MAGLTPAGVSRQAGRKWVQRFLEGGLAGLGRGPAEMERRLCRPPTIQAAMEAAQVSTINSD